MAVPHLRFPFQVVNGNLATVEQDTWAEVAQCVQMVLTTPKGSRIEVPEFGIPDPVFGVDSPNRTAEMLSAVNQWEPRADAVINVTVENIDEFMHHIRVDIPDRPDEFEPLSLPQVPYMGAEDDEGFGEGGFGDGGFGE